MSYWNELFSEPSENDFIDFEFSGDLVPKKKFSHRNKFVNFYSASSTFAFLIN